MIIPPFETTQQHDSQYKPKERAAATVQLDEVRCGSVWVRVIVCREKTHERDRGSGEDDFFQASYFLNTPSFVKEAKAHVERQRLRERVR